MAQALPAEPAIPAQSARSAESPLPARSVPPAQSALPAQGVPADQILAELRALRAGDLPTHGGRLFAYVYDSGRSGLDELTASANALCAHVNGLDPTAFPSLSTMERGLVAAAAGLLGGGPDTVGNVTGGGTESLILAVKAARDAHPEIERPRLVMPVSAHAAFGKAASYLRVALDVVPIDPVTFKPSVADIAAAIGPDTVLVAASAPAYAFGVIDPIEAIAAVAAAAGVRCHVDACFGGWTLPYLRRLGEPVPPFDLSVPGVTSISVDLHKYAYSGKGVSVLLHASAALRRPQYFAWAGWPGYTVVNPGISSTRPGGPIAGAYAALRHIGDDGYLDLVRVTRDSVRALAAAVSTVDGLRLVAEPESTVVCFRSTDPELDVFVLADELAARGWYSQAQLTFAGLPGSIHLSVTASVASQVDGFPAALADACAAARTAGPPPVPAHLLELAATLPPEALTPDLVAGIAAEFGLFGGADGPPRMAAVNTLLCAAPVPLRERLLVEFMSLLQSPQS